MSQELTLNYSIFFLSSQNSIGKIFVASKILTFSAGDTGLTLDRNIDVSLWVKLGSVLALIGFVYTYELFHCLLD